MYQRCIVLFVFFEIWHFKINRLADLGVNVRATEDANHLAVGVLKPDGLTQYEVFYRNDDASTDKSVPNIDQVIKKLME